MIAAILRAQLLSMRLGGRARSVLFSSVTGFIFYGFWAFAAWGASSFFADPDNAGLSTVLPGGLLLAMAYWQFAPGYLGEPRRITRVEEVAGVSDSALHAVHRRGSAAHHGLRGDAAAGRRRGYGLLRNPGPGQGPDG